MARNKRALRLKRDRRRKQQLNSATEQMRMASRWPLASCLMSTNWTDRGALVQLVLMRRRSSDDSSEPGAVGVFLADLGCLGIKNAFARYMSMTEHEALLDHLFDTASFEQVSPDLALKVLVAARDYASSLGFAPHPDSKAPLMLLHDADPARAGESIPVGGPDGKPLFVSGPDDDVPRVVSQLSARLGPDGFDYILRV